jgi:uncharacterized membrane protein
VILPLALPFLLVGFLVLVGILILMVELRILAYAYRKIGVAPRYMFAVLVLSLIGGHFNIPLYSVTVPRLAPPEAVTIFGRTYIVPPATDPGTTVVAHAFAQIVPGVGIAIPMFIPPLTAAVVGLVLSWRRAPPMAYVAGSMGTLIDADLLNLGRVAELGAPVLSIGGAGTFDGVFLTGIIAGLLV